MKLFLKIGITIGVLIVFFTVFHDPEKSAWENALHADTISSYQAYLEEYPNGRYVEKARNAIEKSHWEIAITENSIASYKIYISQYPDGLYLKEAESQMDDLMLSKFSNKVHRW